MRPFATGPSGIAPSGIREVVALARERPGTIRLEVGEPDFPTPAHVVDAAIRTLQTERSGYVDPAGLPRLREAAAQKVTTVNGHRAEPGQVVVGVGGVQLVAAATLAVADAGSEVLVPDPAWPAYVSSARLAGAVPVAYPLDASSGWTPIIDRLAALVTSRTALLVVNSPGNPTGAVFDLTTVRELAAFARAHDLYILADEVYDQLVYATPHMSLAAEAPERTFTVYSLSKTYAMTGWRIGYMTCPDAGVPVATRIQGTLVSCVAPFVQAAAIAALEGPQDCVVEMARSYRERRDAVLELLARRGMAVAAPQGAFYVFVDVSATGLGSRDVALSLLNERGVAVAPGSAFGPGGEGYVRVSLASPRPDLVEGVGRLCDHVADLAARAHGQRSSDAEPA